MTQAGRGETSVLTVIDEASKVRAGETSEPAESNEASEMSKVSEVFKVSEVRSEDMAPELVEAKDLIRLFVLKTPKGNKN